MPRVILVLMMFGVVIAAGPAHALVTFDFEQKYFVEFGPEVKDHCLLRKDGVYHLFYLRGNPAVDIGHATSTDLMNWNIEPPVLDIDPDAWDNRAMWAPCIIKQPNGQYIMYYTGVNLYTSQQAGIAMSRDLYDWVKLPWPVYHPDPSWALWGEEAWSHGRDPFVFEHAGTMYMLNTAKTRWNRGAISLASSSNAFDWVDEGPFYVHDSWHVLESVQLIDYADKYHLFFTEETTMGTSHMSSDSLFSGWDPETRGAIDLGAAPEVNVFDEGHFLFSRHTVHPWGDGTYQYTIKFDTLRWSGTTPYVYRPWPLEKRWTLVEGAAFIYQPTFLNNLAVRGEDVDVGFVGYGWISTYERYQGPLGYGSSGSYQGDAATGIIRSKPFVITGNSMNLLVGGGNHPDDCYVALFDANSHEVLFKETGKNTDEMDRRYWDISSHKGKTAYIEIVDQSADAFGHICCDDIRESVLPLTTVSPPNSDDSMRRKPPQAPESPHLGNSAAELRQNVPNPFNPATTITYYLPSDAFVSLAVFDVNGSMVRQLVLKNEIVGDHSVTWDGRNDESSTLSTGVYFYRLTVDGETVATKKMMLLK